MSRLGRSVEMVGDYSIDKSLVPKLEDVKMSLKVSDKMLMHNF